MTCKIPLKNGEININYKLNTKLPIAQILIVWKTSEESILRAILQKFVSEKVIVKGVNSRNCIINAFIGKSGILFLAPDNKFFSILKQIYNALYTSKVKIKGDYKTLVKDVQKGCHIYCTGKIRTLQKQLESKGSKIENCQKTLNELKIAERTEAKNEEEIFKFPLVSAQKSKEAVYFTDSNKYDLSMLINKCSTPFWFEDKNIVCNNISDICNTISNISEQLLKVIKYQIKGGDIECQKFLNKMFAALYNFKECESDIDDSIQKIKHMKIPDI